MGAIRKNKIVGLLERARNIKVYSIDNGFIAREIPNDKQIHVADGQVLMPFEYLLRQFRLMPKSTVWHNETKNTYSLNIHSNLWYEFELGD